ncbi:MAG: glycosyltransferase [Planctomycetota bacterium]|nr:MAG: glycosyltransferase [Planctomycetota bacterium]
MAMASLLFISRNMDRAEVDAVLAAQAAGLPICAMTRPDNAGVDRLREAGCYREPVEYGGKFSWGLTRQLRRLYDEQSIVAVYASDNKSLANALRAGRGRSLRFAGYRGTLARIRWWDPSYRMALLHPRVERIVCVNRSIHEYMQRFRRPEQLVLAYKGYGVDWAEELQDASRNLPVSLPENAWVLCYIANTRDRPHKGLRELLMAMHMVRNLSVHLVMIGSHDAAAQQWAAAGPAAERIHLLGEQPQASRYLRHAHAYILPSTRDGLPRSIKEAMAQGLPCIITDIPGPSELIEDEVSGLLVPPSQAQAMAAAIDRLANDADLCARLGGAGRQRLQQSFPPEAFSNALLALWKDLLSS